MNIDELIADLNSPSDFNTGLDFLAQVIVDTDPRLVQSLSSIILTPESIKDTNRFASLLGFLSEKDFISPLIEAISHGEPGVSSWLADYMYALDFLLRDQNDWLNVEESFVHLLGKWLLNTDGGEISWKAGLILASIGHPSTKQYFLQGALDQTLLNLTRVECVRGMVNHYRDEADELLQKLSNDPDEHVQEAVADAQRFLNSRSNKA